MSLNAECELLATVPVFAHMSQRQLKLLAMSSERLDYAPGDVVFRQGDPSTQVFLLLEGAVERSVVRDGATVQLGRIEGTAWLGSGEVLLDHPRHSTATAVTGCSFLKLDRPAFLELVEQMPCVGIALAKQLAGRIESVTDMLIDARRASGIA